MNKTERPERKPLLTHGAKNVVIAILTALAGLAFLFPAPWKKVVEVSAPAAIEVVEELPVRDAAPTPPPAPPAAPPTESPDPTAGSLN